MKLAIFTSVVALAAMIFGSLVLGLDSVGGRVVAGLGTTLLWVPISWLLHERRRRHSESVE